MDGISIALNPIDWNGVSAISNALMLVINIFLLITVVVGFRTLNEEVKNRDSNLLLWAIEQIEKIKSDINTIRNTKKYSLTSNDSQEFKSNWTEDQLAAANRVTITLQRLGYLAESGLISKRHLADMWGPTFIECWNLLKPFIQHKRKQNNEPLTLSEGAFSRKDFERFASYCKERTKL